MTVHCKGNLIYVFAKKELCSLSPNFYIHVPVRNLYIPRTGLIWNLYFPVLCERTLGSTAGVDRRAGNCHQAGVGSSSLPSSPLLQLIREFTLMTNKQILAQPQERREGQGTATKQWLVTIPCPPLCFCSWAESSHKWPSYKFPFGKLWIINGNN